MAENADFNSLLVQVLRDMHAEASGEASHVTPQDFDDAMDGTAAGVLTKVLSRFNRGSLVAGAASVVLVIGLAIPVLISWQGGSGTGVARKISTATKVPTTKHEDEQQHTATTVSDNKVPGDTSVSQNTHETQSGQTTKPGQSTVPPTSQTTSTTTTSTTQPLLKPGAPTGFYAYETVVYGPNWKVKFTWNASPTPGVSYCATYTLIDAQRCQFSSSLTATWQNLSIPLGDTSSRTYYLAAVTPDGVVSDVISTTYSASL